MGTVNNNDLITLASTDFASNVTSSDITSAESTLTTYLTSNPGALTLYSPSGGTALPYTTTSTEISTFDLASILGTTNPTVTYSYVENYNNSSGTGVQISSNVTLAEVAAFFNNNASTTAQMTATGQTLGSTSAVDGIGLTDISTWWSELRASNSQLPQLNFNSNTTVNLNTIINDLQTAGLISITPTQTIAPQSKQLEAQALMSSFMQYYFSSANPNQSTNPTDLETAMSNYFATVQSGASPSSTTPSLFPNPIPVELTDQNNPTESFGFPASYYTLGLAGVIPPGDTRSALGGVTGPPALSTMTTLVSGIDSQLEAAFGTQLTAAGLLNWSSLTPAQQTTLYQSSLSSYLQYVESNKSIVQSSNFNFFQSFEQYAVPTAILNITPDIAGDSILNTFYQAIYEAYYPTNDPNNPQDVINAQNFLPTFFAFIQTNVQDGVSPISLIGGTPTGTVGILKTSTQSAVKASGSTDPDGLLSQWSSYIRQQATGFTSGGLLDGNNFGDVAIILTIYNQLLKLLNSLQTLTESQLAMQTVYAHIESVYTNMEVAITDQTATGAGTANVIFEDINTPNQVGGRNIGGTYSFGTIQPGTQEEIIQSGINGNPLGGYNSANSNITRRSDVSSLSNQYTESVKSFRSEVETQSQQQNTAVNQSQEAVSQQVSLAQTLIQQMSTLLQSMWQ